MTSLTRLAYFLPFESEKEYDCLICYESISKGLAHHPLGKDHNQHILHPLHPQCSLQWIQECIKMRNNPDCPSCQALVTERSICPIFCEYTEQYFVACSRYWHMLFQQLMISAKDFQENKQPWTLQAEKVIDEFRFILDGMHRFYIEQGSQSTRVHELMIILEGMHTMFTALDLAIKVKQKDLPFPQEMSFLQGITPSMNRHLVRVVEFLISCVESKKQMLLLDAEDITESERLLQAMNVASTAIGMLFGTGETAYVHTFETPTTDIVFRILSGLACAATCLKISNFAKAHLNLISKEHLRAAFRKIALKEIPFQL